MSLLKCIRNNEHLYKFKFLYADEATEKKEQHIEDKNEQLNTRHMFLDLLHTEILPMPTIKH